MCRRNARVSLERAPRRATGPSSGHYRCVAVVDAFRYANVYRATRRVGALAGSPDALDGCARFALRQSTEAADAEFDAPRGRRTASKVLRLYCAFRDGRSVRDVLLDANRRDAPLVDALDHRAWVAFGVVHGVLRRVYRYPKVAAPPPRATAGRVAAIAALLDGTRPVDAACCAVGPGVRGSDVVFTRTSRRRGGSDARAPSRDPERRPGHRGHPTVASAPGRARSGPRRRGAPRRRRRVDRRL